MPRKVSNTSTEIQRLKDPRALGKWALEAAIESALVLRDIVVHPDPGRARNLAQVRAAEKLQRTLREMESYIRSVDIVCPKCDHRFRQDD